MRRYPDTAVPYLIAVLFVGIAAHLAFLPWWINLWFFSSMGYLYVAFKNVWKLPPKWVVICLTLLSFFLIIISAGRTFDNEAGIGLLCLMASLKPFEINSRRDRMITVFLAYFMVLSGLFFSTTILMTVYMVAAIVVITGLLICMNHPDESLTDAMKRSAVITVQAVPLMLILFFIFPRIQGSLWGLQKSPSAVSGFSTTLSPGTVTGIVKDNAVAFRVEFPEERPGFNELYWRGIVFQQFNGRKWQALKNPVPGRPNLKGSRKFSYVLTMAPGSSKWMFVLDIPTVAPFGTTLYADNTVTLSRQSYKAKRYLFDSFLDYNTGALSAWEDISLSLPKIGDPQSRALAKKLFSRSGSPEEYADKVLQMFEEEMFYYTLNPPVSQIDIIDDFLFNTKKGYCGHYASSFVFLMRAAGVPARIVGGYMGGQMNPYGDYMIVKQSDAHAWAEVWLENRGWVRYDPTAAVAPERVEKGISEALSADEVPSFITTARSGMISRFLNKVYLGWDAANYEWDTKIIGYTSRHQKRLFRKFGFDIKSGKNWLFMLVGGVGLMSLIILAGNYMLTRQSRLSKDPVFRYYVLFIKKMEKVGIKKETGVGPVDYAKYAAEQRPDIKSDILGITRLYTLLRYSDKKDDAGLLSDFRKMVKRFKPGRLDIASRK